MVVGVYLDVETTGRKSFGARVIEVGAVVWGDKEVDRFSTLVNPGSSAMEIASPEALAINGITPQMLKGAPTSERAAAQLRSFLSRYRDATLHAYNNAFDFWFLARDPWAIPRSWWGECVMLAAMRVMEKADALGTRENGKPKWPKLQEAAAFFGIPYEHGHRAQADALVAAKVHSKVTETEELAIINDEADNLIREEA